MGISGTSDDKKIKRTFSQGIFSRENNPEAAGCHHMKQAYQKSTYMKEMWTDTTTSLMALPKPRNHAISGRSPPASITGLLTSRIVECCSLKSDSMLILSQPRRYVSQYIPPPTFLFVFASASFSSVSFAIKRFLKKNNK